MIPKPGGPRPEDRDPDAIEYDQVGWDQVTPVEVELDPALVERIHARRRLTPLTLRVGLEQVAEARRQAAETGQKYQAVLRRWLAEGASRARLARMQDKARARGKRGVPKTNGFDTATGCRRELLQEEAVSARGRAARRRACQTVGSMTR